jgi:uncharacterized protein (TIGR02266 family)
MRHGHANRRVPIEVDVSLTSDSHFFVGLSGDLSEAGLFAATWRELAVGTPLDVTVTLPDGLLVARGRVRWARHATDAAPPGLGIALDELTKPERTRLETFCASRAPWYYELGE